MIVYKFTSKNKLTRNGFLWQPGRPCTVKWSGNLCAEGCLHAYQDPLMAMLCAPYYGYCDDDDILWVAEANVLIDDGTKLGCDSITILREHEKPETPWPMPYWFEENVARYMEKGISSEDMLKKILQSYMKEKMPAYLIYPRFKKLYSIYSLSWSTRPYYHGVIAHNFSTYTDAWYVAS
jgi:hypothetical protein